MPKVPFALLRAVLGGLCVLFAHMAGRTWMAARKGRLRPSRFYAWLLRTGACAVVLIFRQSPDAVAITAWVLAAAAFAAGAWAVARQKPPEDITREMFE